MPSPPYVPTSRPYDVRVAERRALLGDALERVLAYCRNDPSVERIYVHGSYATGKIGIASDLDLLIVRRTDARRYERAIDILAAVSGRAPLDLIVVTPDEFDHALPRTTFGATILATMRRVDAA